MRNEFEPTQSRLNDDLTTVRAMINSGSLICKESITETFKAIRKSIDDHEAILLERIDEINRNRRKLVEEYKEDLEYEEQKLNKQTTKFEDTLRNNDYDAVLNRKKSWTDDVHITSKTIRKLRPPGTIEYSISCINELPTLVNGLLNKVNITQKEGK